MEPFSMDIHPGKINIKETMKSFGQYQEDVQNN